MAIETNILFEEGMVEVKNHIDKMYKRDTQKVRVFWDARAKTVQLFYKFSDSDEAFSPGALPQSKDPDSTRLRNHFLPKMEKSIHRLREVLFFEMFFDLISKKISKAVVYYIDEDGQDKKKTIE